MNEDQQKSDIGRWAQPDSRASLSLREVFSSLTQHLRLLVLGPLTAAVLGLGITYLIPPTFTASTTFLPPQQGQSSAAAALAALGPLASLAGGVGGVRSPGEQFVSLMQSTTVTDRIIDHFKLVEAYEAKFRVDARQRLRANVRISLGKKDGLITVQVDDRSPETAAEIANRYVDELRRISGNLALGEAQQRRVFFQQQLEQSRDKLLAAQQALQSSGFNQGALKAEPKAAADGYARLKAELTSAEVRLQTLRSAFSEGAPEVRQQHNTMAALREQLMRAERVTDAPGGSDYITKYRAFKYQEVLLELYSRQFELARLDESREGSLIQVVDVATPPEKKSSPKRAMTAVASFVAALSVLIAWLTLRLSSQRVRSVATEKQST